MSSRHNFIDLCLSGKALQEEIDDFVDAWHADPNGGELHAYLGMTEDEYSFWLRVPDALPCILDARRNREPLTQVVCKAYDAMRRVPSRNEAPSVAGLRTWLKGKGVSV
jgi:hypothetical protein